MPNGLAQGAGSVILATPPIAAAHTALWRFHGHIHALISIASLPEPARQLHVSGLEVRACPSVVAAEK